MRKAMKMAAALTAAALVSVSLAGCGGNGQTTGAEGQTGGSNSTTGSAANTGTTGETPVITFMSIDFTGNALRNDGSDKVIAMYEEHTGIKVDWRWEAQDTYKEKIGLTLMDKDNMPMVITGSGEMTANIVDAAQKGAFWDLEPFLEDQAAFPNLSQANPDILKAFTVDNQVVGIYRGRYVGRYGFSYRTDWAEKLGLEEPKTPEDVYRMMYAFTYDDPDGNGKDDTFGLEMTKYTGPLDIVQTWFGCGNEWVEQDGKMVPVHTTAEYKDALNWLKKCYDDGLIRKDWATVDSSTFGEEIKKSKAGCFIDVMDGARRGWQYFVDNNVTSVVDPGQIATMSLVGPINNVTLATSGHNGFYLITKAGAKTEEDVRNCLTFLDRMCDDKMLVLADYGLEGVTYELVNNEVVKIGTLDQKQSPSAGLNQSLCYIPNANPQNPSIEMTELLIAQFDAYDRNEKVAIMNPAIGYLVNSPANSEYGTDVEQIIDDARTQYICGQIDEAGLDAAAQQWLDRGGKQIIDEVNQLYDADTGK